MKYNEFIDVFINLEDKRKIIENELLIATEERDSLIIHKIRELKIFLEERNLIDDFNDNFDNPSREGHIKLMNYDFNNLNIFHIDKHSFGIELDSHLVKAGTSRFSFAIFDFDFILEELTK